MHAAPSRPTSQEGAVATEYLFLMVLVAIVLVVGLTAFGGALTGAYESGAQQTADALAG